MSESMSNVERALWRIAELGARCSQQTATGGRGELWAELEQTITALEQGFEAAGQATDSDPGPLRALEGRLAVARKERDREQVRAQENLADAQAARRERDRERQGAEKAVAESRAARSTAAECRSLAEAAEGRARAEAARCRARIEAAEGRARAAAAAGQEAASARNEAMVVLEATATARDESLILLRAATAARDEARVLLDAATAARDEARSRITTLEAEFAATLAERPTGPASPAPSPAAHPAPVVVLPEVAPPPGPAGPAPATGHVSWHPAWSEWAQPVRAGEIDHAKVTLDPVLDAAPAVVPGGDGPGATDERPDASGPRPDPGTGRDAAAGPRRYLNVAATIGALLPEDLGPLLLAGATVVRREGRLFATVAISDKPWAEPGTESDVDHQAQRFSEAGYRVEPTGTPLPA